MFEHLRSQTAMTYGAAALAGSLLITGCSETSANQDPATPHNELARTELARCYDRPLPSQALPVPHVPDTAHLSHVKAVTAWNKLAHAQKKWDTANVPSPLSLKLLDGTGFVAGDPVYDETTVTAATDALVEVSTPDWKGTGFVVQNRGKQVVLTAAHVAIGEGKNALTVMDDNGDTSKVTGGCYIYEDAGKNKAVNHTQDEPVEQDVAVLELSTPLANVEPLKISTHDASRGQWLTMDNYQALYDPVGDPDGILAGPTNYTGLVVSTPDSITGYHLVTGLSVDKAGPITEADADQQTTQPGASGGPALNSVGEVVGMTTSGTNEGFYVGAQDLKDEFNLTLKDLSTNRLAPIGGDSGRGPVIGGMQSIQTMEAALKSPRS